MNTRQMKARPYTFTTWENPSWGLKMFIDFNQKFLETIFGNKTNVKRFATSKEGTIIMACLYIYIFTMIASLGWNAGQGSKIDIDLNLK